MAAEEKARVVEHLRRHMAPTPRSWCGASTTPEASCTRWWTQRRSGGRLRCAGHAPPRGRGYHLEGVSHKHAHDAMLSRPCICCDMEACASEDGGGGPRLTAGAGSGDPEHRGGGGKRSRRRGLFPSSRERRSPRVASIGGSILVGKKNAVERDCWIT
jgi:hypothetical protein